ncbi:conserved hypothetical protein [Coccidioides posadasii str. Silveira]|uniref:Uncharacterized protein n=2 Tax=Coccidioides posadasii TaxID=199306 RepID=E9D941_COCPS|nr:conserved hypothetical protein [Coccidioides posadasii str. Silveira]KMM69987.1 hypothetical protein CPAG_06299 [Coccidioides posadasii RMSCC 3488]
MELQLKSNGNQVGPIHSPEFGGVEKCHMRRPRQAPSASNGRLLAALLATGSLPVPVREANRTVCIHEEGGAAPHRGLVSPGNTKMGLESNLRCEQRQKAFEHVEAHRPCSKNQAMSVVLRTPYPNQRRIICNLLRLKERISNPQVPLWNQITKKYFRLVNLSRLGQSTRWHIDGAVYSITHVREMCGRKSATSTHMRRRWSKGRRVGCNDVE